MIKIMKSISKMKHLTLLVLVIFFHFFSNIPVTANFFPESVFECGFTDKLSIIYVRRRYRTLA